ncbi:hypothetical protein [Streptomyces clavuligerus]|uniref:hypothetical protein n=1 Tax=Streptomyces clavuligerus TaxID=1901 RepID=UPI0013C5186D|nr:hypothetical protein [Streptomyces clavuligerus]
MPVLRPLPVRPARARQPLGSSDVSSSPAAAKGITAECALALAVDTGASLAVLGRSDPARDTELAANLRRMTDNGVTVRYAPRRCHRPRPGRRRRRPADRRTRPRHRRSARRRTQ